MKRIVPAMVLLLTGALVSPAQAQEEPPLLEPTPPQEQPSATPPPEPGKHATPPTSPVVPPTPPVRPAVPMKPLSSYLDFARWQEMSARERQTFVEGAVASLGAVISRLRTELGVDGRVPPERLAAVVKFIQENSPRRGALTYLREMETLYATPEGRGLSMIDCFQQAFRRANVL